MSHTSWSPQAHLGAAPTYHLDPIPGGAPVVTPDGRWQWDGGRWLLRDDLDVTGEPGTDARPTP